MYTHLPKRCPGPVKAALLSAVMLLGAALSATAQGCRQALILGLDVSLSVDTNEFALQRRGLARALQSPEVIEAMTTPAGGHIELAVFEWSGQFNQALLIDWTVIDSAATLDRIAGALTGMPQGMRSGRTGLGAAMLFARDMLQSREHCGALTLDLSGDGMNNNGILPARVRPKMDAAGITVNALVIEPGLRDLNYDGAGGGQLRAYFEQRVITGPAAFAETIVGFQNYAEAIKRKLLRELVPAFVRATPPPRGARVLSLLTPGEQSGPRL